MSTAKIKFEVRGINETIVRLLQNGELTEGGVAKGLLAVGLLIQRRAQLKTPVEYGNLRGSAFARQVPGGLQVQVGFSAVYARAVHEKTAEKLRGQPRRSGLGTYWNPGESEFLLKALTETRVGEIVTILGSFTRAAQKSAGGSGA
jgi:hypothetical protein